MTMGYGYTGPIEFRGTGLPYIHRDRVHIGLAQGGGDGQITQEQLIQMFNERQDEVFQKTQQYYTQLFMASLSEDSIELLEEVFVDDNMMGTLNEELAKKIQSVTPTAQLGELHNIQQEINLKLVSNLMSNGAKSAESFDKVLDAMARACQLLNTPEGGLLAIVLSNAKFGETKSGRRSIRVMGSRLQSAVNQFMAENDGKIIDGSAIQGVVDYLNTIAIDFKTGKFKKGKGGSLTENGVRELIDNLFSTQFGEGIAALMNYSALSAINQNITTQLTGGNTVRSQLPSGEIVGSAAQGKADITTENVNIHLDYSAGAAGGNIELTVGISAKTYKNGKFMPVPGQSGAGMISSGSAGSLEDILADLFQGRLSRARYLADNTFAHGGDGLDGAQQALQALILKRQIVNLFAARGGSLDFAQFLLVNGRIIAMWDIIQAAHNYSGLSASVNGGNDPVVLTIHGRPEIYAAGQESGQEERVFAVAKAIRDAKVLAKLNLARL